MAKQTGLIKIEGTLDQLTFYKTADGDLVRMKGGVSGDRIANDPVFARTRENGAEFGMSATAGKLLRDTIRTMLLNGADPKVTSRLTKVMSEIKNYDNTSVRGERNVAVGIAFVNAQSLLLGFNFNERAILGSVLFKPYTVNITTGVVAIPGIVPINDLSFPDGATHVSFLSAFASVDFATGDSQVFYSPESNLAIDGTSSNITLTPSGTPTITGTNFFILQIKFFQEVNGVQYSLKNGAYNPLAIIALV